MLTRRAASPMVGDLGAHLDQLDAAALRELLLEAAGELEPAARARLADAAARRIVSSKGRRALPAVADPTLGADVSTLARAMKAAARADPSSIDELFGRLNGVWVRGEHELYRAGVMEISRALDGGVDLGHDELYTEVLATDTHEVACRLLVSAYLTAPQVERPNAIQEAGEAMDVFMGEQTEPLDALERTALDPLPDFDEFARAWTAHLRARASRDQVHHSWALKQQLREAIARSEGANGLADRARSTHDIADYKAWVKALLAANDAAAAAAGAREGAHAMTATYHRADLLMLAARIELLSERTPEPDLRAALDAAPTSLNLRRWLACVPATKRRKALRALDLHARDASALAVMVQALRGEWSSVAGMIARAAPLGWSSAEHAGVVGLDAVLWALDAGSKVLVRPDPIAPRLDDLAASLDESVASLDGLPKLAMPTLLELLDQMASARPSPDHAKALRDAVSKAARARVVAVADGGRRSGYDDAAHLVAIAASLYTHAGDSRSASRVVSEARAATGRKRTFTQAIDRAAGPATRAAPLEKAFQVT